MSEGFPSVGTKWKAFCGTFKKGKECMIELGASDLIVDSEYKVPYAKIIQTEKWDTNSSIARLMKLDPIFAGWEKYRKTTNVKYLNNTIYIQYIDENNNKKLALFSFKTNQISDWYGFSNAMKMIVYGAKPQLPKTNSD